MVKYISELTEEQKAQMAPHAEKWIQVGWNTDPADWDTFASGAERCYGFADLRWTGVVTRVSDPLVLSIAAPVAAHVVDTLEAPVVAGQTALSARVYGEEGTTENGPLAAVRDAVLDVVTRAVPNDALRAKAVTLAEEILADRKRLASIAQRDWHRHLGGQWWVNWQAWTSFFRDVCDLELEGDLWDRDRAYADAQSHVGWWWPHELFVMVSDRPRELHIEQVGPAGWGSHRLHNATGPAIRWSSGWGVYSWHGVVVPADLIEQGWDFDRIMQEDNQEIRRAAVERLGGWHWLVESAGLACVAGPVDDPGNPGGTLELFEMPKGFFDEPVRLLLCRNGTPERDGSYRRFGLTVPASISDPVAAAAWGYNDEDSDIEVTVGMYRQLARRS